ncbi:glutamate 5-kinase [Litoribrevibacter euphylliae]|uniref:Glutamate 5-kinase n=1 Tax=Litoribrevibacter euphylliae TaxID=1834034 RepID=A0ABV7HIB7_9GAMM
MAMKFESRESLGRSDRWVVKIGSALLTNDGEGLDRAAIAGWVDQISALVRSGIEVVLVSSGSVAEGMKRLGLDARPKNMHQLQAAAAVGQMGLVQVYEENFKRHQLHTAQILLTHDDLSDRQRYLNARSTLKELIRLGVVPVVNENDTVVTDEIKFGDNDTLGALVANLVEADLLVILTDQQGLFTADPRSNPDATLISETQASNEALDEMASGGAGVLGRGGMATKVRAARLAARSGAHTVVASGRLDDVLLKVSSGQDVGTWFKPDAQTLDARKQWLAGHLRAKGELVLDAGAVRALTEQNRSLLSVGVRQVSGVFNRGEVVVCRDESGHVVAHGLVNYDVDEVIKILGKSSERFEEVLGYLGEEELIHRDNLVLM